MLWIFLPLIVFFVILIIVVIKTMMVLNAITDYEYNKPELPPESTPPDKLS
jgi:hypothetical protein